MIIIKRLKLVNQESSYDCGLACLLMIARYYNCNVSRDHLEKLIMPSPEGTSMYDLLAAMTSLGFDCYGKKGTINDINKNSLPLIAHIKIDEKKKLYHYVTVVNITNKKVTIKDPSNGTKTLSKDEFNKIETGNYLFIKKTLNIKKFIRRKIIFEELKKLVKNNKFSFILMLIATILSITLELLNLFSLKIILNNAILVKSISNLVTLLFIFSYLLFLKSTLSYLTELLVLKLTKKFNYFLKLSLIKHLLSLPNLYYQTKEKGIILSLFNDVDTLTDSLLSSIITFTNSTFILIFIYIFFASLSSLLTLILLSSSIVLFIFIYSQKKMSSSLISKLYQVKDIYNSKLQQVITNNEKIKGLHLEELMFKKIRKTTDNLEEENYIVTRYTGILKNILNFLEGGFYLVILGVSGILLITSTSISITTFLLLESLIYMSLKNVENLILILLKYQNAKKAKERLDEIFNYQKEVFLPFPNYHYITKNISITISNLSFKYFDNTILDNVNITINPKDKVFIYGDSGSGKSTLVKLLGRFLPIEFGHIKIGNIDITHYNLADLRNIITYISNDTMLSNGDIKGNIYLSRKPHINQNTLLKITGIDKLFKEKKYSLNTIIQENGENISMGERSRISLAQGLFRTSEIDILDECLSNVDIALEKEILENILNYYQDKIVIYISHRLTNKNLFNRIFYLEKGKCYEKL